MASDVEQFAPPMESRRSDWARCCFRRGLRVRRAGQAMLETVIAVLIVTSVFLALFKLSHMLMGKIMLEHAAMRVARARAVGFNDFMCRKVARVAVMPVAGRRIWPEGDGLSTSSELARVPVYLQTRDESRARGVLEYDGWNRLEMRAGDGLDSRVSLGFELFDGVVKFDLDGKAGIEPNASKYLNGGGM